MAGVYIAPRRKKHRLGFGYDRVLIQHLCIGIVHRHKFHHSELAIKEYIRLYPEKLRQIKRAVTPEYGQLRGAVCLRQAG